MSETRAGPRRLTGRQWVRLIVVATLIGWAGAFVTVVLIKAVGAG